MMPFIKLGEHHVSLNAAAAAIPDMYDELMYRTTHRRHSIVNSSRRYHTHLAELCMFNLRGPLLLMILLNTVRYRNERKLPHLDIPGGLLENAGICSHTYQFHAT